MKEIRNTNDKTRREPYVRFDIAGANLFDLPSYSSRPQGDAQVVYAAAKEVGFQGVQGDDPEGCLKAGLRITTAGRVDHVGEADAQVVKWKEQGYDCATLHVGSGLEDDKEAVRLFEHIVEASTTHDFPLYVETHRATVTQDIWRTVQLVRSVPGIRLNGDFSHWYTGLEMVYGDIDAKLDFMEPVFERVRFIHGRIGSPGSIQVGILPDKKLPAIAHFREMWTRSFMGFLRTAQSGDYLCFTPELLGPQIYYARLIPDSKGELVEESDRWQEAIAYLDIARECFAEAQARLR